VRRLALYIESSLRRGLQWAVFGPNQEPLWSEIRRTVGDFLHNLFLQGALQGQSPKEAYLVQCDATTTTPSDIESGRVNLLVGFAPLKPAEFILLQIQIEQQNPQVQP
jgi:phage tail sheath protein FI